MTTQTDLPCCVGVPLPRAIVITPVKSKAPRSFRNPWTAAFPFQAEGRLSPLAFSGPARRSLTLWPAGSQNCPRQPFPSKALAGSLPPRRLRLLPVGTIRYRGGSRTHQDHQHLHGARLKRQRRTFAGASGFYAQRIPLLDLFGVRMGGQRERVMGGMVTAVAYEDEMGMVLAVDEQVKAQCLGARADVEIDAVNPLVGFEVENHFILDGVDQPNVSQLPFLFQMVRVDLGEGAAFDLDAALE